MTAHFVSISKAAFFEIMENLPPACRFVDVQTYPDLHHAWFYTATGDVVVITPEPIEKLQSYKLTGFMEGQVPGHRCPICGARWDGKRGHPWGGKRTPPKTRWCTGKKQVPGQV